MSLTPPTPSASPQTISLGEVANRYLEALQRIYDIVSYSLASSRKINEHDYDEFSQQLQVMPRQQCRMDFEQAKDATEHWFLRNSLGDSVALVVPLMEDCRTISALCNFKVAKKNDAAGLQKIVSEDRTAFLQLSIKDKFKHLEQNYSVSSPVQEHIEGLVEATRILMWKNGIVTAEDTGTEGKIKVKIRSVQLVQVPGNTTPGQEPTMSIARRMGDAEKVFNVGDKISLTKAEHIGSIITVGLFIASMLQALKAYAKKTGAADD
jgi:hypothetical protein